MVLFQVADGDGLHIWRIAVNILNKQSQTAEKGWSYRRGLGMGLELLTVKKISLLRNVTRDSKMFLVLCGIDK
jgi:hypothetical protein